MMAMKMMRRKRPKQAVVGVERDGRSIFAFTFLHLAVLVRVVDLAVSSRLCPMRPLPRCYILLWSRAMLSFVALYHITSSW